MFALHSDLVINMRSLCSSWSLFRVFYESHFSKRLVYRVTSASGILAGPITTMYMLATSVFMSFIFFYLIFNPNEIRMKHILVPVSPSWFLTHQCLLYTFLTMKFKLALTA